MHLSSLNSMGRIPPFTPKVKLRAARLGNRVAVCARVSEASFKEGNRSFAFSQSRKLSLLLKTDRLTLGAVHTAGGEGEANMSPALHSTSDRFFTSTAFLRHELRRKWLEAARAAAGESSSGAEGEPIKPQVFIVKGEEILLSTSPVIPGHTILHYKGLAEGSSVRGRSVLQFWKQQLQQQLGGEQQVLHDLLRETRQSALQRLAEAAAAAGANAVVSVRLVTSGLQRMHAEYTAYGTAVRVSKSPHQGTLSPH